VQRTCQLPLISSRHFGCRSARAGARRSRDLFCRFDSGKQWQTCAPPPTTVASRRRRA